MSFEFDAVIRTTILLLVVCLAAFMLKRTSAATRHAVWVMGLLAALAVPVVLTMLPAEAIVELPLLPYTNVAPPITSFSTAPHSADPKTSSPAVKPAGVPEALADRPEFRTASSPASVRTATPSNWTLLGIARLLWALGAILMLARWFVALWQLRRMRIRAHPLADREWTRLLETLLRKLPPPGVVSLRIATDELPPMTWGVLRSIIQLPASATEWSEDQRRMVLAHELAHVKRGDMLGEVLCRVACSLYWFNPLVWYAVRRLRAERERACDDHVLRLGCSPTDYAAHLLHIARRLNSGFVQTAVSMARPSDLRIRTIAILNGAVRRRPLSISVSATLLVIVGALALAVSAIQITALAGMARPTFPVILPEAPQLPTATGTLNDVPFRLRVDVNLAQLDVAVQDRTGKSIDNLRASDFRLFENGVERPLQAFSKDERPLAVALVLERDRFEDSGDEQFGKSIKNAAYRGLSLLQGGDSASLFVFGYTVEMFEGQTTDLKRIADRIRPISHYGGGLPITKGGVYVAVHEATAYLARTAPDKRRAVILFSDERDSLDGTNAGYVPDMLPLPFSLGQTIQLAVRNETPVYSVKPPDRTPRSSICCGSDFNPRLIQETGGKKFAGSQDDIEKALAIAIGQLKSGYTLGYDPGNAGGNARRIEVRLVDRFGQPNSDYTIAAGSVPYNEPSVDNVVAAPPATPPTTNGTQTHAGTEVEFVKVASGSFTMGFANRYYKDNSNAPHKVTLTRAFELGRFEVTQAQWQAVMGSNPSDYKAAANPVNTVSWDEIQEFIRKMNARNDGYRYRLPTEAEWEYSARAGTTDFGMGGDKWYDQLNEIGWYAGNAVGQLHSVGQKKPNEWGLYDMYGNVWEWVADWYGADYYNESVSRKGNAAVDPQGPSSGTSRVLRGGSWNYLSEHAYIMKRWFSAPDIRSYAVGFRLLRERSANSR